MQDWFLPSIMDYWDWKQNSIEKSSSELSAASPDALRQNLTAIIESVQKHVRSLPDRTLLDVVCVAADHLFMAGNRITEASAAIEVYIEASAGTLFSLAKQRGCLLHYLVDNRYEQTPAGMQRPMDLYGAWFSSAGLVYICPQLLALSLMQADKQDLTQYFALLPKYIAEAVQLANSAAERCHSQSQHYAFLNADSSPDPFPFTSSMAVAASPGVVTALRNEAPDPGSNITVIYPHPPA